MRSRTATLFILLLILPLFPNRGGWASDTLNLLVWEGYAPADQVARFERRTERRYGKRVRLEVRHLSDPNQFYDYVRGGYADIITPTHNLIRDNRFDLIRKRLLLPVDLNNVPNHKKLIPTLKKPGYMTENGRVYGVPFAHGPYGLAYNAAATSAPESWDVLWDPAFKNRYAVSADYYEANIYITALAIGLAVEEVHRFSSLNTPLFRERLMQLAEGAHSLWRGVDKADSLQGLSLAVVWGFSLPELRKRGEPWEIAIPREGTMYWVDNYAIGHSLGNKPFLRRVAEEWLDFVLSDEFQIAVVVRGLGSGPVNAAVRDRLTPEERERPHVGDPHYLRDHRFLWPTVNSERDRNGMKMLWNNALRGSR